MARKNKTNRPQAKHEKAVRSNLNKTNRVAKASGRKAVPRKPPSEAQLAARAAGALRLQKARGNRVARVRKRKVRAVGSPSIGLAPIRPAAVTSPRNDQGRQTGRKSTDIYEIH